MRDILNKLTKRNKEQEPDSGSVTDKKKEDLMEKNSPLNSDVVAPESDRSADEVEEVTLEELIGEEAVLVSDTAPFNSGETVDLEESGEVSIEDTAVGELPLTMIAQVPTENYRQKPPNLKTGFNCELGKVRDRNEDSIYVLNTYSGGENPHVPFGLYIVADGMGGHHAGHDASHNAASIMAHEVSERILLPLLYNGHGGNSNPQSPIGEVMLGAVKSANKKIYTPDPEKEGGTTVTAALIIGRRLYIAHVGDSRAYIFVDEHLKQVTTDHSYVRRLMEAGQLTEEEAALHPQRNMLYRAVGQGGDLEIDTFTQTLPSKGKLVLCSDGLWGLVPDSVIEEELRSDTLQKSADYLVDYALKVGGHDNISIIIVNFSY